MIDPERNAALAAIDAAYLDIAGRIDGIDLADMLAKMKRLAEEAIAHPCTAPKAMRIWKGEE